MFWESSKNSSFDANNKFKFLLLFEGFPITPQNNTSLNNNWVDEGLNSGLEQTLYTFCKSVTAPNINIEFERAYANEYVHYFQNGSIHWESINIKFADFSKASEAGNYQTLRKVFDQYIQYNLLEYDIATKSKLLSPLVEGSGLNRTRVVDMPKFCNEIKIFTFPSTPKQNYPTSAILKDLKNGKSFDDLKRQYSNIMSESFRIYNPIITKVDFGGFDYNSDEINEISITIVPEWCSFIGTQLTDNAPRDTFGVGVDSSET